MRIPRAFKLLSELTSKFPPAQSPLLAKLTWPLRIVAHTQVQFDLFLRAHRIRRDYVIRVMGERDVRCVRPDQPLILLEGWQEMRDADEILAIWHNYGGTVLCVSDERALGLAPLCENDTDGDGNCDLCAKKGGCCWPKKKP